MRCFKVHYPGMKTENLKANYKNTIRSENILESAFISFKKQSKLQNNGI